MIYSEHLRHKGGEQSMFYCLWKKAKGSQGEKCSVLLWSQTWESQSRKCTTLFKTAWCVEHNEQQ